MSLKTWKEEFYPITAYECEKEDALNHSLQKWIGMCTKNLKKHECHIDEFGDVEDNYQAEHPLSINDESCALCVHHLEDCCETCPLAIARKDSRSDYVKCDQKRVGENISPWASFKNTDIPKNMIYWLKRAVADQTTK